MRLLLNLPYRVLGLGAYVHALCLSSMKASSWWHKEDFLLHVSVCEQFEKRSGIRRSVIDTNLWPSVT